MKHILMAILGLVLCWVMGPELMAEEADRGEVIYSGEIEAGVRAVDDDGDSAKFEEYRDMGDGLYGNARIQADQDDGYIRLDADRIGRDDQRYDIEGGRYGKFKFSVLYDEIPHNYTRGAGSHYNGVGGTNLVDSGNLATPSLWQRFDYDKDRKNGGFKGEYNFKTPFYVEFGGSRQDSDGIYPVGSRSGTELPVPIDWKEDNWFLEGGYQSRSLVASLRADVSDFDNENTAVSWDGNTTTLAPDSEFFKFSGRMVYRHPFLSSQASLRASLSQKENTTDLSLLDPGSSGSYNGEVSTTRVDGAWDFAPAGYMDMKLYAKYSDTDDDSDILTINSVTTMPYDHEKIQAGLDTTFEMPRENFLDLGYRYTDAERSSRTDNDSTEDNEVFLQYRNRYFENFLFRARFEYLDRDGSFRGTDGYFYNDATVSYQSTSTADDGTRRYDVADQVRNRLALEAEYSFTEQLYGAVELDWWDRDYDDTVFGLTGTEHHEVYLSAGFGGSAPFSATVYLGFEHDENDTATDQNWSQTEKFETFAYGINLEYPAMEDRLRLILSWDHSMVDGKTDFSPASGSYTNLTEVDDCTVQRLEAKGIYSLNRMWDVTLGYVFEKFDLDDGQYDGYTYLPSGATLTGAYAEQDYDAHIIYIGAVHRF